MVQARVELLSELDLQDYGEIRCFPGDINGDGVAEIIFMQASDGPHRRGSTGGYKHQKTVHAVTAINLKGEILWQNGTPIGVTDRKFHGAGPCMVHDLNCDGKAEVVYVTVENNLPMLRLLNGPTGQLVKEVETGASYNFTPANLRGLGAKRDFILGAAINPVFAYTEDLEPLWDWHFVYGAGHHHAVADVNGDGFDEAFIGVCGLNAQGERLWWRPDLDDAMEEMGRAPHIDNNRVVRLFHNSPEYQVIWIGGRDVICLNALDGSFRWRFSGEHVQNHAIGRFNPDSPDQLIFFSEKAHEKPSYMLDANGKVLWEKQLGQGVAYTMYGAGPGGSDLAVNMTPLDGERPYAFNHLGEKVVEFPVEPYTIGERRGKYVYDDLGQALTVKCFDLDGDGQDEVLLFNRKKLYAFKIVY